MAHYASIPFRSSVLLAVGASSSVPLVYSVVHRNTRNWRASDSTELSPVNSQGESQNEWNMSNGIYVISKRKLPVLNNSIQSDLRFKNSVDYFASSLSKLFRHGNGRKQAEASGFLSKVLSNQRSFYGTALCEIKQAAPSNTGTSTSAFVKDSFGKDFFDKDSSGKDSFDKNSFDFPSKNPPYPVELNPSAKNIPYNMEILDQIRESANIEPLIPTEFDLKQTENILYQYDTCPFCRKVRCCLDLLKIPYKVVEVHPIFKKEVNFSSNYKKVPILVIHSKKFSANQSTAPSEHTSNDSSAIILKDSKLIVQSLLQHEGRNITDSKALDLELAWLKWTDTWLVQLIVMNIYRTLSESVATFAYLLTHPSFSSYEKYLGVSLGAFVMWLVSRKKRKQYAVTNEREELCAALNSFVDSVGTKKFHGGEKPNACDIAVFGILRSIKGFECEADIFNGSNIGGWYKYMQEAVGPSQLSDSVKVADPLKHAI